MDQTRILHSSSDLDKWPWVKVMSHSNLKVISNQCVKEKLPMLIDKKDLNRTLILHRHTDGRTSWFLYNPTYKHRLPGVYLYRKKNPSPSVNFDLCILFVHSILICLSLSAFLATYFDNTLNLSWTCLKYGNLSTHFKLLFNVHYEDTSTFLNIETLKKVCLTHKFGDLIFNISFIVQP